MTEFEKEKQMVYSKTAIQTLYFHCRIKVFPYLPDFSFPYDCFKIVKLSIGSISIDQIFSIIKYRW